MCAHKWANKNQKDARCYRHFVPTATKAIRHLSFSYSFFASLTMARAKVHPHIIISRIHYID
jgi:hypothetical protein